PYRLEMGTRLKTNSGSNLYQYWGDAIALELNRRLAANDTDKNDPVLLNLASAEYFKAVSKKALKARIVECVFQDQKNGAWKIISFYAKKARGLIARYIIDNKISNIKQLHDFNVAGYYYVAAESTTDKLVF